MPRLEESPVDSSFPSGHTAAAAAYGAIAVVVFWRFRNVWVRTAVVALVVAIPIIVGVSRVYAGMHYLTDVVAGVLLGLASVFVVWLVLRHRRAPADVVNLTLIVVLLAALRRGRARSSARRRRSSIPIDPAPEEQAVVRSIARHPRLDRFLRRALRPPDSRRVPAHGRASWSSSASPSSLGLLLDMIDAGSGLAELDDSVAEWGAEHATSSAVDVLEVITDLGGTTVVMAALLTVAIVDYAQRRNAEVFAFVAAVGIGQLLINNLLKLLDRPRPSRRDAARRDIRVLVPVGPLHRGGGDVGGRCPRPRAGSGQGRPGLAGGRCRRHRRRRRHQPSPARRPLADRRDRRAGARVGLVPARRHRLRRPRPAPRRPGDRRTRGRVAGGLTCQPRAGAERQRQRAHAEVELIGLALGAAVELVHPLAVEAHADLPALAEVGVSGHALGGGARR